MNGNEKRAHDLALLYMQIELKEGKLQTQIREDYQDFIPDYNHHYRKILTLLNSEE